MSLANPIALLWGALIVPIVIFYILKIRLKRVPVPTVIFWRQIFDEKKPRSIWQKLRHLISLLLQIAFVALVILALARPLFFWETENDKRIILVLDNSASMNATDVAPSRLEKAKEEASRVIRGLHFRDEMAIVAAGAQPRVVCGLTGHRKTLWAALAAIPATDGPTRLEEALALARRLAAETEGSGKQCRVVVVTDGAVEEALRAKGPENAAFITVGKNTPNIGITRFQVRRSAIDPIGYEILAEVANLSDEQVDDVRLSIALNGNTVDIKPLKLAPNARVSEVIESTTADGGLLTAELVVKADKTHQPYEDALASDNKAVAILPKREPIPVHLHSPQGNLFLQKALEAHPLVRLTTSKEMPKEFVAGTVHIFHRETPARLPAGHIFVVEPANDSDLWKVGDKLQSAIATQVDKESPLMAHVRLENVLMPDARKLELQATAKPLVLASAVSGEPLFAVFERREGKVAVLTVNLDLSELPFRTAFPILAMNALTYFSGGQGELRESLATGAIAEVALPANPANDWRLRAPDGSLRPLPGESKKVTVGPFDLRGVWSVVSATPDSRPVEEFAVNVMNKEESDLRPREGFAETATAVEAGLGSDLLGEPTWWRLIAAAFVLIVGEWYLYQRRWIS